MTLFLGYFLLLLPKRLFPLVKDVTSPPVSPLLGVTLEACRWCYLEPKFNHSPKIHLLAFSRVGWCFLIGKDATEIDTALEILPLTCCIPPGNNKYTVWNIDPWNCLLQLLGWAAFLPELAQLDLVPFKAYWKLISAEAVTAQFLHQRPKCIPSRGFHHRFVRIGLSTVLFFPNEVAPWVLISLDSETGRVGRHRLELGRPGKQLAWEGNWCRAVLGKGRGKYCHNLKSSVP